MQKILHLTYESSISNLCEINSSFDCGVIRVAYTNENRNGSSISKDAFLRSIDTIYNCPIVCNYNRDTNSFGGHDVDVYKDDDGNVHMVNLTTPIGVIPESANYYFEEFDGREYLCVDALIWKRQEAYNKLKEDGYANHSMEISIKDGYRDKESGFYIINNFEFNAFCILGDDVEPCFENSAIEMFSRQELKTQIETMMGELKESFNLVGAFKQVDNKYPQNHFTEGGETVLDKAAENFETVAEGTVEEVEIVEEVFEAEKPVIEEFQNEPEAEEVEEKAQENSFALNSNIGSELHLELDKFQISTEWGAMPKYWMTDFDLESGMVYVYDNEDNLLYGFPFVLDGDSVVIDYACKKRMKYVIEEFKEKDPKKGCCGSNCSLEFTNLYIANLELNSKYQQASESIMSMDNELKELRQFKADAEENFANTKRAEIIESFQDLVEIEEFATLCENAAEYTLDTFEEKCYALRGKYNTIAKFSLDNNPRLPVDASVFNDEDKDMEPYGGIVKKYKDAK